MIEVSEFEGLIWLICIPMTLFVNVKFVKRFDGCENKSICKAAWISSVWISYWPAESKWTNSRWVLL